MVRKKDRIRVVIDTNVLIANYLSTYPQSPNVQTIRLWRERKLQLIVSDEIVNEYTGVLAELSIPQSLIDRFVGILNNGGTATHVNLGKRITDSRDPKDNPFLSTASAGRAKYLLTNDYDLLDIPDAIKRKYKFQILTPVEFLQSHY